MFRSVFDLQLIFKFNRENLDFHCSSLLEDASILSCKCRQLTEIFLFCMELYRYGAVMADCYDLTVMAKK